MRMFKKFVAALVFSPILVFAQSSQLLKCQVVNAQWSAVLQLDAVGVGLIKFKQKSSGADYSCNLKLEDLDDGQRAIVPHVRVVFERGNCTPELSQALEKEVLQTLTVMVSLFDKGKPQGTVQWLKRLQPEACKIEKFRLDDIQTNAKKWLEGKWGRRNTVIDPKSAKSSK